MNDLTQRGIMALKAGDRASARKLLAAALQQDQNDATAWLWLAAAVDTPGQRIDCLKQVLKIEPQNEAALKGLAALGVYEIPEEEASPAEDTPQVETQFAEQQTTPEEDPLEARLAEAGRPVPALTTAPESAAAEAYAQVQAPVQSSASAPVSATASAPVIGYRPPLRAESEEEEARKIFNVRPSNVPALLAFWIFFIGAIVVGSQVSGINPGGTFETEGFLEGMPFALFGLLFGLGLGVLLELVVLYVVIRNLRTHYELTSASLTVPYRSRKVRIPVREIYHVECQQSFLQKLFGAGDVLLDAAVQGELAHLRLRSIPGCHQRAQEIAYLIQENAA